MKHANVVLFLSIGALATGCNKIKVPYFDDLSPEEVCGGFTEYCQPPTSPYWVKIKPSQEYSGDASEVLGRVYTKSARDLTIFCIPKPTEKDILRNGEHNLTGSIQDKTKNQFVGKLDANIIELLGKSFPNIDDQLNAELAAQVTATTQKNLTQDITMKYQRVVLNQDYIDKIVKPNLKGISDKNKVVTGMSVITVEGNWSKQNLTDVFANIEASAAYKSLNADLKNEFTKNKNKVLQGEFKPITYYFAITYLLGKQ